MNNTINVAAKILPQHFLIWLNGIMTYQYNSTDLVRPPKEGLTEREEFLLKESKTFCIYPWIHLHAYPTGEAYPCCHAEMKPGVVGNCRTHSLEEIWHGHHDWQSGTKCAWRRFGDGNIVYRRLSHDHQYRDYRSWPRYDYWHG